MPRFTEEEQTFIVTRLACFARDTKVAKELEEQFGTKVEHTSHIAYYDAASLVASRDLAQHWADLFWKTRERYINEEQSIAIAHRSFRLRELNEMLEHRVVLMDPNLKLAVLEQAAKEKGGLYQQRVTPGEAQAYVAEVGLSLKTAIDNHVTNPQERDRVHAEVKKLLENEGAGGTP